MHLFRLLFTAVLLILLTIQPAGGLSSAVWAASGSGSEGTPDDDIEERIEEEIEEELEERLEEQLEDEIEEDVEDRIEEQVEGKVDDKIEDQIEDRIDNRGSGKAEDRIEREAERKLEEAVEGSESTLDEDEFFDQARVEAKAEFDAARKLADIERDTARAAARASMEEALAQPGADEESIKQAYDDARDAADDARDEARESAEEEYESTIENLDESGHEEQEHETAETSSSSQRRLLDRNLDEQGNQIAEGEWLVIASLVEIRRLEKLGYVSVSRQALPGLGQVMTKLRGPESFSPSESLRLIRSTMPAAVVDYNHLYFAEDNPATDKPAHVPGQVMKLPKPVDELKIGLIDTALDASHPALRTLKSSRASFIDGFEPTGHGTRVASILAGADKGYRGLLPDISLYAASVFTISAEGRKSATTESLVRALDWMVRSRVPVVNMSLAGPRNRILEVAINQAASVGTIVVAAVGNRGPSSPPLFPAAFDKVVAVTAVDVNNQIYRLACRGEHVDFAAPGVNILHASKEGYASSSGISLAVPFVTAAIALSCSQRNRDCIDLLRVNSVDLGSEGFDPVFGHGLIHPLQP